MVDLSTYVTVGESIEIEKVVTDEEMKMFATITGDFDPLHIDDDYAKATQYGKRIAYGLMTLGLMSGPESDMSKRIIARNCPYKPVSLGYDKVRFIGPVFIEDVLTVTYTIESLDSDRLRSIGDCLIKNQKGETVVVAKHIMKWLVVEG